MTIKGITHEEAFRILHPENTGHGMGTSPTPPSPAAGGMFHGAQITFDPNHNGGAVAVDQHGFSLRGGASAHSGRSPLRPSGARGAGGAPSGGGGHSGGDYDFAGKGGGHTKGYNPAAAAVASMGHAKPAAHPSAAHPPAKHPPQKPGGGIPKKVVHTTAPKGHH